MIPNTTSRVAQHTSSHINAMIQRKTEINIERHSHSIEDIDRRLDELDREWDIERTLEVNGSVLLLAGLGLGVMYKRRWLLLPMFVGAFCLQHAIQGWCPPLEIFRRLGIRTSREIENERTALRALRGDFKEVQHLT